MTSPTSESHRFETGSYRDRHGRVVVGNEAVYRLLDPQALDNWHNLRTTDFFKRFNNQGMLIATEELDPADCRDLLEDFPGHWAGVLGHERIPVVSYPYEWPFSMLRDAAACHLDLLVAALSEDWVLKDATSYNVQWRGCQPVFIDIPSFEPLPPGRPWMGYRQFCELFLLPLMVQALRGLPFQPLLRGRLDGIDAATADGFFGSRDWLKPGVFRHAVLHARMLRRYSAKPADALGDARRAGFNRELIRANVRGLRKIVTRLAWHGAASRWSEYSREHSYSQEQYAAKQRFVKQTVEARPDGTVWDLGCNTGDFSIAAARHARHVVATDADHAAVERLYLRLRDHGPHNVLPLTADLADPSPDQGWRGRERAGLVSRIQPDLVLCLALLHHAVIGASIPMDEFIDWLADTGADLVIEYVDRDDPMVQALLKAKDESYADYSRDSFMQSLKRRFHIAREETIIPGRRWVYQAEQR